MTMRTSFSVTFCLLGFVKTYTNLITITTYETGDTIVQVVDGLANLNIATKKRENQDLIIDSEEESYTTDVNSPTKIENLVIEDDEDLSEGSGQTNAYADLYTTTYEARYTKGYTTIPTARYSTGYTTEYPTVAPLQKKDFFLDDESISDNSHASSSSLFTCSKLTIICVFVICCIFGYVGLAIINNLDSAKNNENAAHLSRKSQTVIIGENP